MAHSAVVKNALCHFTTALYDKILAEQGNNTENVLLSPLSIYTAFIMTMAGAGGNTKAEMMNVLHVPKDLTADNPHQIFGSVLLNYFQPSEGSELSIANRLFILQEVKIVEQFKQCLQKHYKADAELLSKLGDLEAKRAHINNWVAENTKQKIKDLIPPGGLHPTTMLAIMNALYFRGFWKNEFDKANTHSADFHCLDGSKKQVQLMYKEEHYAYADLVDEDATALKIPFKGMNWELLIILPNQVNGLPKLIAELRKEGKLARVLTSNFGQMKLRLFLPRFKLDSKTPIDLKAALTACGMKSLFDRSADLSQMCSDTRLFIDSAFHKAVLEVDETGVTAAAATGLIAVAMCLNPEFRVDRPFFVALVCDKTVPVFVGHVVQPESV